MPNDAADHPWPPKTFPARIQWYEKEYFQEAGEPGQTNDKVSKFGKVRKFVVFFSCNAGKVENQFELATQKVVSVDYIAAHIKNSKCYFEDQDGDYCF